jgi:multiple sugar transport system substrate-binding protein
MKIGKLGILASTVGAAVMALAACSSSGGSGGSQGSGGSTKTITFVAPAYSSATQGYLGKIVSSYEAANPGYKVTLTVIPIQQRDSYMKTLVQTGKTPDLVCLEHWADYASSQLLNPVSSIASPSLVGSFLPALADEGKQNGTAYALPYVVSDRLFFYNKSILAKAGIKQPPASWQQLQADSQKIKAKEPGVIPYGLPLAPDEAEAETLMWLAGNGGGYNKNGKWTVNDSANVATIKFLTGMVKAGLTTPNPASTQRSDVFNEFAQGKIGMIDGAVFLPTQIKQQNPSLQYGVSGIPVNAGQPQFTLAVQDYLMSFKHAGNTAAVERFVDYLYKPTNYNTILNAEGFLPPLNNDGASFASNPTLAPFVKALPSAILYPNTQANWPVVQGAIQQQIGLAVQGQDPSSVLGQIQQVAQQGS